eukprot:210235_1
MGGKESKDLSPSEKKALKKFEDDKAIHQARLELIALTSNDIIVDIVESVRVSFRNCSPLSEATLFMAWIINPVECEQILIEASRRVLNQPIDRKEFEWYKKYVISSAVLLFKKTKITPEDQKEKKVCVYNFIFDIVSDYQKTIIASMNGIYEALKHQDGWYSLIGIRNIDDVMRQDDPKVGLLTEATLLRFKESVRQKITTQEESKEDGIYTELETFIDSHLVTNILVAAAQAINKEFQSYINSILGEYGKFQPGPLKEMGRCASKVENDYKEEPFPKTAKLCDLVRCSVTFNTADQLLEGYKGLMNHLNKNASMVELARIKNGFLDATYNGGYRDIKINVVYKSQLNPQLKMICEIQLMLINYLQEKKRIHKLYSILRDEIYFQMVAQQDPPTKDNKGLTDLKFEDALVVGQEVELDYKSSMNKCSVDSDLGLLCMEGINWFGVIDMKQKKAVLEMERDSPINPWYARQSHQWITINQEKYLSVQVSKTEIKMFKVSDQNEFVENDKYRISLPSNGVINYCDFDHKFESILLIINFTTLQKRSMKDINNIITSIELEEKINQSSFRNLGISDDGSMCALGGGGYKNYFYVIDINNNKQYKMISDVLSDTYAPCFINGQNELLSMSDKKGKIEIWDIMHKKAINTLKIGVSQWVTSSASTNNILAIASWDKKLRLYDVRNWELFYTKQYNCQANSLHLTRDLKYLTFAGRGGDRCFVLQIE